jgi:hypothetical protein
MVEAAGVEPDQTILAFSRQFLTDCLCACSFVAPIFEARRVAKESERFVALNGPKFTSDWTESPMHLRPQPEKRRVHVSGPKIAFGKSSGWKPACMSIRRSAHLRIILVHRFFVRYLQTPDICVLRTKAKGTEPILLPSDAISPVSIGRVRGRYSTPDGCIREQLDLGDSGSRVAESGEDPSRA